MAPKNLNERGRGVRIQGKRGVSGAIDYVKKMVEKCEENKLIMGNISQRNIQANIISEILEDKPYTC